MNGLMIYSYKLVAENPNGRVYDILPPAPSLRYPRRKPGSAARRRQRARDECQCEVEQP